MKRIRLFLCLLLIVGMLLPIIPHAAAADADAIIRELIVYYCHHQENAGTDIQRLLQELEDIDPRQAAHWREIMDYWHTLCTQLSPAESLPEGLPQDDSLCIVVFGFALNYNGTPKEELEGRLNTALAAAGKYPNAYILCTGGGTAPGNRNVTEAGQMAAWLKERGIDPDRIITENRSYSTEQNAQFCLDILQKDYPQIHSLALVSSDYHLRRCHLLFQTLFILKDLTDCYQITGCAAYPAGYVGESGYAVEADGIGILLGTRIRGTTAPSLSVLTHLTLDGPESCAPGEPLDLTVTAHYDTGFSRDVTEYAEISGFDPELPGLQDVTVTYTENGHSATASFTVTVPEPPTEAPTTAPEETETFPTENTEPDREQPVEQPGSVPPSWLGWVLIPLGGCLPPLILLLAPRKHRGKYQK